jgi:hypothetical protein
MGIGTAVRNFSRIGWLVWPLRSYRPSEMSSVCEAWHRAGACPHHIRKTMDSKPLAFR